MSEVNKIASADAGSDIDNHLEGGSVDPNKAVTAGQSTEKIDTANKDEATVPESQYKELEKKLGTQGEELGTMRKLFEDTSPFLEKLDKNPDLAKAILEDKIDPQLLEQVLEGKIEKKDAETVSKAHEDVKKDLGKKEYDKRTPEEINELLMGKISEATKATEEKFTQKLTDMEKLNEYQKVISDFITNTPDFAEYSEDINKFISEKNIDDIEVAYNAVKGKKLQEVYKKEEDVRIGEAAKNLAGNAGGGASQSTANLSNDELVDKLIFGQTDPNKF